MRLNSEIEALKSFFLEQIFIVKKSQEEKQLRPRWISEAGNQIPQSRKPNEDCHQLQRNEDSSTIIKTAIEDRKTITDDLPIAEIFNNYFSNGIRSLCDRQNQVLLALKIQFLQQSINSEIIPVSSLLRKHGDNRKS